MESEDPEAGGFCRGACRVILSDECQSGRQRISEIIKSVGAQPIIAEELGDLCFLECSAECCVAVVVTGVVHGGVGMQAIRDLKAKGFKVIACEDGAGSWMIKIKCLPLLAGAVQLLDCSTRGSRAKCARLSNELRVPRCRSAAKSTTLGRQ